MEQIWVKDCAFNLVRFALPLGHVSGGICKAVEHTRLKVRQQGCV